MSKRTHAIFMIVNGVFVILNLFFAYYSEDPSVNYFAAMFCLIGLMVAYVHWAARDED